MKDEMAGPNMSIIQSSTVLKFLVSCTHILPHVYYIVCCFMSGVLLQKYHASVKMDSSLLHLQESAVLILVEYHMRDQYTQFLA